MSNKGKNGDFGLITLVQQHNRNVELKRQADAAQAAASAAKESARQAKIDRENNDRHRAQMEAIARQKAAFEQQRLKLLEDEREAKKFSQQQCSRLYDISCRFKQLLTKEEEPLVKLRYYYELKADFENIVSNAITDLQYRKLHTELQDSLCVYMETFAVEHAAEMETFLKYRDLEHQLDPYLGDVKINSAAGMNKAKHLLAELKNFSTKHPELALDGDDIVQECINRFVVRVTQLKGLRQALSEKGKIESRDDLDFLLCNYFGTEDDIFADGMWQTFAILQPSRTLINDFCLFCFGTMVSDASLNNTVLRIFESVEAPETVPAIQQARRYIHARLIQVLLLRNRRLDKMIIDKNKAAVGCGCAVTVLALIVGIFFPPVLIVSLIGLIVYLLTGFAMIKMKRVPVPELLKSLGSAKNRK